MNVLFAHLSLKLANAICELSNISHVKVLRTNTKQYSWCKSFCAHGLYLDKDEVGQQTCLRTNTNWNFGMSLELRGCNNCMHTQIVEILDETLCI